MIINERLVCTYIHIHVNYKLSLCSISRTESDKSRFDQSMVETRGAEFHKRENKTTAGSRKSDP